jgi:DNA-binding transcriptional MocR family regulator
MAPRSTEPQIAALEVISLLGDWSAADPVLYLALAESLQSLIVRGDIPPGTRLPAERTLAASLIVSRGTVMSSYDLLRQRGFLSSRQGSGTHVRVDAPRPLLPDVDEIGPSAPSRSLSARFFDANPDVVDLAVAGLHDADPLADEWLPRTWEELEALSGGHGYAPQGLKRLRAQLCGYYSDRGLRTSSAQITVTGGAQQALDLAAALALRPGDRVLVESPTYPGAIDTFARHGAQIESLPFNSHWDRPAALREAIALHAPRLVYLMPGMHNPAGRSLPDGRRREIARLADEHELYVIEDNTMADVTFDPRDQTLLAAYSTKERVLTLGSLSKSAWGGLRVGWMRSDAGLAARAARIKASRDLGVSPLPQLVAIRVLAGFEELLTYRRSQLTVRCATLQRELAARLPHWQWSPPDGGLSLWVRLPDGDADEFAQLALRRGVAVIPGSAHCLDGAGSDRLRIAFTHPEPVLIEGVRRLQAAWAEYVGFPTATPTTPDTGARYAEAHVVTLDDHRTSRTSHRPRPARPSAG